MRLMCHRTTLRMRAGPAAREGTNGFPTDSIRLGSASGNPEGHLGRQSAEKDSFSRLDSRRLLRYSPCLWHQRIEDSHVIHTSDTRNCILLMLTVNCAEKLIG
jgi:hypothetical protein